MKNHVHISTPVIFNISNLKNCFQQFSYVNVMGIQKLIISKRLRILVQYFRDTFDLRHVTVIWSIWTYLKIYANKLFKMLALLQALGNSKKKKKTPAPHPFCDGPYKTKLVALYIYFLRNCGL